MLRPPVPVSVTTKLIASTTISLAFPICFGKVKGISKKY
nr:MAG TPA_asm: hypothetical protein [Caudoviricetes sp.]